MHQARFNDKRFCFVLLNILTILLLTFPQPGFAYKLDKKLFLGWVEHRMLKTRTSGLSGKYFSIGEIPRFIATVDNYLNAVYVDEKYLKKLAPSSALQYYLPYFYNLVADQAYTQGKGADANKHPSENDKYDGSIILVNIDKLNDPTAFHESIHIFSFARKLGDLDMDKYNGPEFISSQFYGLLIRLHTMDRSLDNLIASARAGDNIKQRRVKLIRQIQLIKKAYVTEKPEVHQLLHEMGGKADFKGYLAAVNNLLDKAEATGRKVTPARSTEMAMPRALCGLTCRIDDKLEKWWRSTYVIKCYNKNSTYSRRELHPSVYRAVKTADWSVVLFNFIKGKGPYQTRPKDGLVPSRIVYASSKTKWKRVGDQVDKRTTQFVDYEVRRLLTITMLSPGKIRMKYGAGKPAFYTCNRKSP